MFWPNFGSLTVEGPDFQRFRDSEIQRFRDSEIREIRENLNRFTAHILQLFKELKEEPPTWLQDGINLHDYADTHEQQFLLPMPEDVKRDYGMQDFDEATVLKAGHKWLARRQNVKYPVLPVESVEEMRMFRQQVPGTSHVYARQFRLIASEWNQRADGKEIFYKVPEQLDAYFRIANVLVIDVIRFVVPYRNADNLTRLPLPSNDRL